MEIRDAKENKIKWNGPGSHLKYKLIPETTKRKTPQHRSTIDIHTPETNTPPPLKGNGTGTTVIRGNQMWK
jgi:hypothetical protein